MTEEAQEPTLRPGLHRTSKPHPTLASEFPSPALVFVGRRQEALFVVRPYRNEHNCWFWQDPVHMLTAAELAPGGWAPSLIALPAEGFYTLPRTLNFDGGGRWLEHAIVQLGYNREGQGILFVGERRSEAKENALYFSNTGKLIDDALLFSLRWAPILPVGGGPRHDPPLLH